MAHVRESRPDSGLDCLIPHQTPGEGAGPLRESESVIHSWYGPTSEVYHYSRYRLGPNTDWLYVPFILQYRSVLLAISDYSTPPGSCLLIPIVNNKLTILQGVDFGHSKQHVDDFWGGVTV